MPLTVRAILDWLFPVRLDPWRTCTNCHERKAKERMIRRAPDWFCDEDCEEEWIEKFTR